VQTTTFPAGRGSAPLALLAAERPICGAVIRRCNSHPEFDCGNGQGEQQYRDQHQTSLRWTQPTPAANAERLVLQFAFARILIAAGDAARGAQAMREVMQLNPFGPTYYRGVLANALEQLGQTAEAIELLTAAVRLEPDYFSGHLRLASLYGLTGQIEEAQKQLAIALRINPKFTMAMVDAFYASAKKESTERFRLGLTKAGLPG